MAKYHINGEGNLGKCNSTKGKCPFGGASGNENHYDNIKDATMAFEKRMGNETIPNPVNKVSPYGGGMINGKSMVNTFGGNKKITSNDGPAPKSKPLGQRVLNNIAKTSKSEEELLLAARDGSARVHASLVKNPYATSEALRIIAREGHGEIATLREAFKHNNYPVSDLSGEEFAGSLTRVNRFKRLQNKDVNDEHIDALRANEGDNFYSPNYGSVSDALSNPNNKVSMAKVEEVLRETPSEQRYKNRYIVSNSGKVDVNSYLKNKTADDISFEILDRSSNQNVLNGVIKWVEENGDDAPNSLNSNYKFMQNNLASNPHMSSENLDRLAAKAIADDNGQLRFDAYREGQIPGNFARSLHSNPNISSELRKKLEDSSEHLKTTGAVQRLVSNNPNISEELITVRGAIKRLNGRGTYNQESFTIDKDKAAEHGLNDRMIRELYGKRFNAGVSYDEKTGVVTGRVDSSD